ncbi:hypothetical protein ACH36K_09220 [Clostridium sp. MB05]|jgi:ABC-type transport system involved in multi-copper enzyme maturation permease subunit|uniref:hypothetical protein n=1 Tax=Clostridium sp. MB05 TaxID=3376682 RepID=UPI00398276FB
MLNLMKQELKRNKIDTYILASIISCVILIIFTYFVAYVAKVENEVEFQNYNNIFKFVGIISLLIFSIMSTIMYVNLVINDYKGARLGLLFSYPVNRKKILISKILIVFIFSSISIFICTTIPFILFSITEIISPIVKDTFSLELLFSTLKRIFISILGVGGIGIISMRIGFIKKSVPTALVTSFILSGILGNIIVYSIDNVAVISIVVLIILCSIAFVILELANKINNMEVD